VTTGALFILQVFYHRR